MNEEIKLIIEQEIAKLKLQRKNRFPDGKIDCG
jgi:hypothetical protein